MEAIRIWLNGDRVYSTGVRLYMQYGNNPLLKRLFSQPDESTFKKEKLADALASLLPSQTPISEDPLPSGSARASTSHKPTRTTPHRNPGTGWSQMMDAEETKLFNEWKPIFSERNDLASRIGEIAIAGERDQEKRKEAGIMALRILDLDDECDRYYTKRDYYLKNKKLPEDYPYGQPCLDPKLIPLKLENALKYARDYRAKLKKDPGNSRYQEQLTKHEWFIAHYNKELNRS